MASSPRDFERFLSRVHRRYIALRLLEQTGLGIFFGCIAGLFLFVIAIFRAVPPTPLIAGALIIGAALGLLHGLLTRPRLHDAAAEADRQLDTADLLTTALTMRNSLDPWAGAVLASANQWSRRVKPSTVLLNRLGARAWGGIGLATTLLCALALLPTYATPTEAAHHAASQVASPNDHADPLQSASPSASPRTIPDQQPEDLRPNPTTSTTETPPSSIRDPQSAIRNSPSALNGQGHAESHTAAQSQRPSGSLDPTQSHNASPQGRDASGNGQSARNASPGNSNSSQTIGLAPTHSIPPWKSTSWNSQAQQALRAVDSGEVSDTYRDVIHGYFDRP